MAQGTNQRARQGGFTRPEVAFKKNHPPRIQQTSQFRTGGQGGRLVGQRKFSGNIWPMHDQHSTTDFAQLKEDIRAHARSLGFAACGVSHADTREAAPRLRRWLAEGRHGGMDYMARHAELRIDPQQLVPGTLSVLSLAIDYLPAEAAADARPALPGVVSRYARGRDYHKVVRQRLQKLADFISTQIGPFGYRVFSDSAPVLEVEFARQAGLGWRGKHTLLLSRAGSWRFLGDIYTDLPLPADAPLKDHCGSCTACLTACPTGAILAPYEVDARRCISYLTIELDGAIPEALRPAIGTRIYGCDDCQTCCPWNRFAKLGDPAFAADRGLEQNGLDSLFAWSEEEFNQRLAGNPIRRIGHERWLRNIAVALGNLPPDPAARAALVSRADHPSALVREHVAWALARQDGSADHLADEASDQGNGAGLGGNPGQASARSATSADKSAAWPEAD